MIDFSFPYLPHLTLLVSSRVLVSKINPDYTCFPISVSTTLAQGVYLPYSLIGLKIPPLLYLSNPFCTQQTEWYFKIMQ